ncbi:MAG: 50S ribosomal protein L23 [bacterium]|nr:50S ribosomal protein L23 [bacterium]
MSKTLLLKPRLSEKAYGLSEKGNTYVFDVPITANRHTVGDAVASQYKVGVVSVRIASTARKPVRSQVKRGRNISTSRSGVRKAYVTLVSGDKLPLFAGSEDSSEAKK